MRRKALTTPIVIVAISILAISVSLATAQQAKQQPHYYVFNLGDPGGGLVAGASGINNLGWMVGYSWETGNLNQHAFLWAGTPVDLNTLGGPNSAVAWPNKNNHGLIAGIAETADMNPLGEEWSCAQASFYPFITGHICLGFIWQDGVMTPLPPSPGGIDSYASGINDKGQVVGWAENGVHDPTCNSAPPVNQILQFEAAVWGPGLGQMRQLSPLAPDPDSAATAINDKGQIVGISGLCANAAGSTSAEHAVLWESENAPPINLGNFDGGLAWNTPTAINNRGQIVGFGNQKGSAATAFNPIAFFWNRENGIKPINPYSTDTNSWAWGINLHGQVVGQSFNQNTNVARAFLYENGEIWDMNSLIQADSSLDLQLANDINDSGEIVGTAIDTSTGDTVAFLAVPVNGSGQPVANRAASFHPAVSGGDRHPFMGNFSHFALHDEGSK